MTYLATLNGSASFWVVGDTIYHTAGTDAGPWSEYLEPNQLYKTTIGDEESTTSCDVGFAINACTISVEDGVLTAVDGSGTVHEVNLSECSFT